MGRSPGCSPQFSSASSRWRSRSRQTPSKKQSPSTVMGEAIQKVGFRAMIQKQQSCTISQAMLATTRTVRWGVRLQGDKDRDR